MTVKEYRQKNHLKQAELVEQIAGFCPEIDVPLLSKIERGIVEPPKVLQEYVDNGLANDSNARKNEKGTTYQSTLEKLLNEPNYRIIYEMIASASFTRPMDKRALALRTKLTEREVRRIIGEFRKSGIRIGTCSGKKGYWLCQGEYEYNLLRNDLKARAMDLLRTIKAMDNSMEGQVEM